MASNEKQSDTMETPSELQTKTRKVGLLSASKRSFFAANQPAAGAGHENVNGGIIRNELFFEESEQIQGTQREAIVVGNTYRMAPDPQKKFSPGKFLPPIRSHLYIEDINLLLTEREGRTGEYWPEVVAVRTGRSEVCTKTTEGEF